VAILLLKGESTRSSRCMPAENPALAATFVPASHPVQIRNSSLTCAQHDNMHKSLQLASNHAWLCCFAAEYSHIDTAMNVGAGHYKHIQSILSVIKHTVTPSMSTLPSAV